MKKITTVKKLGMTITTLLVCLAILITCFTFTAPFASRPVAHADAADKVTLFSGLAVAEKCAYGENIEVPVSSGATVSVITPSGKTLEGEALGTATDNKYSVKANEVGNYTVVYESGDTQYKARVYVTLEEDYFLKVANNGAGIPTYMQKDAEFTVPDAYIAYYDENNILCKVNGSAVTVEDSFGKTYKVGDAFKPQSNGKNYLTYSARLGDDNSTKYFTETFTINVQNKFEDTVAPTISVSGVSSDVSVNRAVTLPKATASDSYDENIKIVVEVTDPDNQKVRKTDVDKYGYAYQDATKLEADKDKDEADRNYPVVEFDNDKAMTFYPVKLGTYKISYQAFDDAGNASGRREYNMTVSDLAAPVFQEVEEYLIPETWGLTVKGKDESKEVDDKITFTVPTVVDNYDHMYADPSVENDNRLISLYFRITDADNSKTILTFDNILAADKEDGTPGDGRVFKGNSTYGAKKAGSDTEYESYTFDKEKGFTFDFGLYNKTGSNTAKPGSYTVLYRARDKAGNTSSKTYTINLKEEYTDSAIPTAAEVNVPSYISENDEKLTIPSPIAADAEDTRPYVVYRVYTNNGADNKEGGNYITVKGGEIAEFVTEGAKRVMYINKGETYVQKLELGTSLYFYVSATDKVGNFRSNVEDEDGNYVDLTQEGNEALYTDCAAEVKVIKRKADADDQLDYVGDIDIKAKSGATTIYTGDKVEAGNFQITTTADMRAYTGFEVGVYDEKGNPLTVTLETFSTLDNPDNPTTAVIYVKNISFKVSTAGKHYLSVRAFNVNGKTEVNAYPFEVVKKSTGGTTTTAAAVGSTGNVNVTYKLNNEVMKNIGNEGETYYVVRKIEGGAFSLMGSEFTAKSVASYYIRDGYIHADNVDTYDSFDNKETVTPYGSKQPLSISDIAAPVFEVQGVMPTYAPLYDKDKPETLIKLPSVIAYSENGNAVVTVKVLDKDSKEVKTEKGDDNTYTFQGTKNGVYKVTYTATYSGADPVTLPAFEINVGDVIGPEFTYSGGSTGRLTLNDKFTFGKLELTDKTEDESTVQITKRLIDPSKAEVTAATVTGSFKSKAETEKPSTDTDIELNMAGTYEVVYTVTDAVGNSTVQRYTITVSGSGSGSSSGMTWLSTTLIVVAVVLLAGVIIYVVRFRKVKK